MTLTECLTSLDRQIIAGLARGHGTAHIADRLKVSQPAVKARIAHARHRLELRGLAHPQLVHYAYTNGHLTVPSAPDETRRPLPLREAQSLAALTRGLSVAQTAAELLIAPATANMQRRCLYRRLDAHTGAHAVALAWQLGLLGPGSGAAP